MRPGDRDPRVSRCTRASGKSRASVAGRSFARDTRICGAPLLDAAPLSATELRVLQSAAVARFAPGSSRWVHDDRGGRCPPTRWANRMVSTIVDFSGEGILEAGFRVVRSTFESAVRPRCSRAARSHSQSGLGMTPVVILQRWPWRCRASREPHCVEESPSFRWHAMCNDAPRSAEARFGGERDGTTTNYLSPANAPNPRYLDAPVAFARGRSGNARSTPVASREARSGA